MLQKVSRIFTQVVRVLVTSLGVVAGLGVVVMMCITCTDVILRAFGHPFVGAYDLVKLAGVITMACALPYTTAVKGHVAIEYFVLKLSRRGRLVVDTFMRIALIALFAVIAWHSMGHAGSLKRAGEVTLTLQVPVFWVPYVIAFSSVVVCLVVFHNLIHPGKEMIKP